MGFKRIYSTPRFLLKSEDGSGEVNRFAVIISTNAVKKSVRRHFWRRQITEHVKHWPNFKKDFLIIVSPGIENANKKIVWSELEKARIALGE